MMFKSPCSIYISLDLKVATTTKRDDVVKYLLTN